MKKKLLRVALALIAIAAVSFAFWTISPLVINKEVSDTDVAGAADERGPFPITATAVHPATGAIKVFESADSTTVRYENYDGTNGPDLHVYLAKDLEANEFIDLGKARGNRGNINYEVPAGVDIGEYPYVLTWCKAFGVLFDYAHIN